MREFIWYLPSGAGGMAAWAKTGKIRNALREWFEQYNIVRYYDSTTYSENGLRYFKQAFDDVDAVLFALTWDQTNSAVRYEYSKEVHIAKREDR